MNKALKSNLRRIVLDSYLFYTKMDFPTKDVVTPLTAYLQQKYNLDDIEADSLAVRISFRATGQNGAKILDETKEGYVLSKSYNLRDFVRKALKELEK